MLFDAAETFVSLPDFLFFGSSEWASSTPRARFKEAYDDSTLESSFGEFKDTLTDVLYNAMHLQHIVNKNIINLNRKASYLSISTTKLSLSEVSWNHKP